MKKNYLAIKKKKINQIYLSYQFIPKKIRFNSRNIIKNIYIKIDLYFHYQNSYITVIAGHPPIEGA